MARQLSLATRGLLAVGLMVGFYVLAISVAGALFYIPYAEWVYFQRIHFRLAFGCCVAGAVVLWSIVPRRDRFEAPGPELRESDQPALFGLIREVADEAKQAPPKHVYLTLEVNAWVTERGGWMGIGSRRVMGLGLPLVVGLTVDELRAVLAHEFGHFSGSDTKLGPWIYKTRSAIERSLAGLGEESWVRLPFVAYSKLFLRITSAVSRQQEFAADALAARVVGAGALSSGLKKLAGLSATFSAFWVREYAPVLLQSKRAPFSAGFSSFLTNPAIAEQMAEVSARELDGETASVYDSHPPTASRCAALEAMPSGGSRVVDTRAAIALLASIPELERSVLAKCVHAELADARPLEWREAAEEVWIVRWRGEVEAQGRALDGYTADDIAELAADPTPVARLLRVEAGQLPDAEEKRFMALSLISTALGVALHANGWTPRAEIAGPLTFHHGENVVDPSAVVKGLAGADGELERKGWPARVAGWRLAGVPLAIQERGAAR
jgi:Zn-dependent protease with chaperone function